MRDKLGQLLWPDNQKPTLHLLMEPYGDYSFIVPMYKAKPICYNNLFEDCTSSKVKCTCNCIGAFGSAIKGQTLSLSLSLSFSCSSLFAHGEGGPCSTGVELISALSMCLTLHILIQYNTLWEDFCSCFLLLALMTWLQWMLNFSLLFAHKI